MNFIVIVLVLLGIFDASYLTVVSSSTAQSCLGAGCEYVLNSPYSKFWGVPVSSFAIAYFLFVGISTKLNILSLFRLWVSRLSILFVLYFTAMVKWD